MSDDDQREQPDDEKPGGIDLQSGNRRIRIGSDESKTLLGYTGNAWRAVVWAIAYAVAVIATFFAMSLTQ
jgi:hypothetical protein